MKQNNTLEHVFRLFCQAAAKSKQAQEMITQLKLDAKLLDIGFNTGESMTKLPNKLQGFGKGRLIVALKDDKGQIINLCAIAGKVKEETFYHHDKRGYFPMCLNPDTHEQLYLIGSILQAAVMFCQGLKENEVVIACPSGEVSFTTYLHIRLLLHPKLDVTFVGKVSQGDCL